MDSHRSLPAGTVTFLFTDIEGSTRLLQHLGDRYVQVLADQRRLLRAAFQQWNGHELGTEGDSFFVVFARAPDALAAAVEGQRTLAAHPWPDDAPIRVRMGLHTGETTLTPEGYVGLDVHRAARINAAGHGGQILLSQRTHDLAAALPSGVRLRDMGAHRLKDLLQPEHLFQVVIEGLPADFPPLKSLSAHRHNLPLQLTSFIGREREMADVKQLLGTTRLLTLTGAGGVGKTRLALQVAADHLDLYPDGVWWAELAPLADPALLPQTVASSLGVREEPNRPVLETLIDHLQHKRLLLLLDNCEHLLEAGARLSEALLRACSELRILATSRQALGILAETAWRVPSLSLPEFTDRSSPPMVALADCEASHLFIDRARSVLPTLILTDEDGPAIGQICHRLDGIPLAIELAAARVKVLSAREIAIRLDDRFRLLTGGSRTALPRQQTLRATIDWSYDLLSEAERVLLLRLSVFAGGWSLEAAEALCRDDGIEAWEVLDLLSQLVDKSLVVVDEGSGAFRYRLLETVRHYSWERLLQSGEAPAVRDRHRQFFLRLAEEAEPAIWRAGQARWLEQLETEHDNLRSALDWSAQASGAEAELRLAGAMGGFWHIRGYLAEGSERLAHALSRSGGEPSRRDDGAIPGMPVPTVPQEAVGRAKVLIWAGMLAWFQTDLVRTAALCEASLSLARQIGDQRLVAHSLIILGFTAYIRGEFQQSVVLLAEGSAVSRETGDSFLIRLALAHSAFLALFVGQAEPVPRLCEESMALSRAAGDNWNYGLSLLILGIYHLFFQGDVEKAMALFDEGLALYQSLGDTWMAALSRNLLGLIAQHQGDFSRAAVLHRKSLDTCRTLGDKQGIALSLEGLASVVGIQGHAEAAVRLLGAADALRVAIEAPLPPFLRPGYERGAAALCAALGEAAFAAAWSQGQQLPVEQAVRSALELSESGPPT